MSSTMVVLYQCNTYHWTLASTVHRAPNPFTVGDTEDCTDGTSKDVLCTTAVDTKESMYRSTPHPKKYSETDKVDYLLFCVIYRKCPSYWLYNIWMTSSDSEYPLLYFNLVVVKNEVYHCQLPIVLRHATIETCIILSAAKRGARLKRYETSIFSFFRQDEILQAASRDTRFVKRDRRSRAPRFE